MLSINIGELCANPAFGGYIWKYAKEIYKEKILTFLTVTDRSNPDFYTLLASKCPRCPGITVRDVEESTVRDAQESLSAMPGITVRDAQELLSAMPRNTQDHRNHLR